MRLERRSPGGQGQGGRDGGQGPNSAVIVWPPPWPVNEDCDFSIGGPDPLALLFRADWEEVLAQAQRRREKVRP